MKNTKNNVTLTPAERMAAEARIKALRAEANELSKALKADEAAQKVVEAPVEEMVEEATEEVVEAPAEEVAEEATEEVVEAPAEEVVEEATEEVVEAPAEEVAEEATEEVVEAPAEEVAEEAAEEVVEAPAEEVVEEATEEVVEAPAEEVVEETTEEVVEAPAEEVAEEATEEVVEAPAEEAAEEATEEVVEAPAEEVAEEATEEVVEAPAEEAAEEATEEVVEAPAEEVAEEATQEVVEAPAEEAAEEATEEVVEAPAEEVAEEATQEVAVAPVSKKKSRAGVIMGAIAMATAVIALCVAFGNRNNVEVPPTGSGSQVEAPANPEVVVSEEFKNGVVNIAKTLTDDVSVTANADILVEKIGEDKLSELIGKYGELPVQKAIAQYLAFVPEVKMQQYIANNGLAYNPNAADDYSQYLDEADAAYTEATGKNPNGALMSLEGYDTYKSNRDAMKALIIESGDTALLTWYEAKTEGYDLMLQQERDTEAALAYKETVKTEILTSQGTVDLLELQLEQEANGTLTVMDNATMQYTDSYNQFIIDNYIYVIANN